MIKPNKRLLSIVIGLKVLLLTAQNQVTSINTKNSARIVSNGIGFNGIRYNGAASNQFSDSPAYYLDPSQVQATLNNQTEGTISTQNGQLVFRASE